MSSTTGVIFSYAIGLIFLVGGLLFLVFLDQNRFLFGIPYTLMGVVIIWGMRSGRRRRAARERREAELGARERSAQAQPAGTDA